MLRTLSAFATHFLCKVAPNKCYEPTIDYKLLGIRVEMLKLIIREPIAKRQQLLVKWWGHEAMKLKLSLCPFLSLSLSREETLPKAPTGTLGLCPPSVTGGGRVSL